MTVYCCPGTVSIAWLITPGSSPSRSTDWSPSVVFQKREWFRSTLPAVTSQSPIVPSAAMVRKPLGAGTMGCSKLPFSTTSRPTLRVPWRKLL